jgi:hypothetical protein
VILSAYAAGLERGGDFAHWAQLTNGVDSAGIATGTTVALGQMRLNVDTLLHARPNLDVAFAGTYFQGGVRPADRIEVASDLYYVERHQSYRGADAMAEARWFPSPRFNLIVGTEGVFDREFLGAPFAHQPHDAGSSSPNRARPTSTIDFANSAPTSARRSSSSTRCSR